MVDTAPSKKSEHSEMISSAVGKLSIKLRTQLATFSNYEDWIMVIDSLVNCSITFLLFMTTLSKETNFLQRYSINTSSSQSSVLWCQVRFWWTPLILQCQEFELYLWMPPNWNWSSLLSSLGSTQDQWHSRNWTACVFNLLECWTLPIAAPPWSS